MAYILLFFSQAGLECYHPWLTNSTAALGKMGKCSLGHHLKYMKYIEKSMKHCPFPSNISRRLLPLLTQHSLVCLYLVLFQHLLSVCATAASATSKQVISRQLGYFWVGSHLGLSGEICIRYKEHNLRCGHVLKGPLCHVAFLRLSATDTFCPKSMRQLPL